MGLIVAIDTKYLMQVGLRKNPVITNRNHHTIHFGRNSQAVQPADKQ